MSFEYNGSTIETDENGYLITLDDWNEGVADKLAEDEEIQMNNEHWEIINFLRDYYQEYQIAPAVKVLTKAIAKRNDIEKKEASVFLYELFPNVTDFTQHFCAVMISWSWLYPKGMKFRSFRNLVFDHGITADYSCPISFDGYQPSLPVAHFSFIGILQLIHNTT